MGNDRSGGWRQRFFHNSRDSQTNPPTRQPLELPLVEFVEKFDPTQPIFNIADADKPGVRQDHHLPKPERPIVDLAARIRLEGMGIVRGYFPPELLPDAEKYDAGIHNSYTSLHPAGQFIQGTDFLGAQVMNLLHKRSFANYPVNTHKLIITNYQAPRTEEGQYQTVNGFHGEDGWTQYDYASIQDLHYDGARENPLHATFVVPPTLAVEIDAAIAARPDEAVMDQIFREVFPSIAIGNAITTDKRPMGDYGMVDRIRYTEMRRVPAIGLEITDTRENKAFTQRGIRAYSAPVLV